jgi:replicative superfamily II helicase
VTAIKLAVSKLAIGDYVRNTLLYHIMDHKKLDDLVESTLHDLAAKELIAADSTSTFEATKLGKAIVMSSFAPEDGIFIYKERRAVQAFVMDGEMHFPYMFTPIQSPQVDINWQIFRKEMNSLDESDLRALRSVGIKPAFINRMYVLYNLHRS